MASPLPIVLHELVEETGDASDPVPGGASTPVDIGIGISPPAEPGANPAGRCDRNVCFLTADLTAMTSSLTLALETSTGGNDWTQIAQTQGIVPNTKAVQIFAFYCKRFLRVRWVFFGFEPPLLSATFSVIGDAHQCYIDLHDLEQSMPANMFAAMPAEVLAHAMLDATDEAESYLRQWYSMPLISWSHALRLMVGKMAFYHAMIRRGYNPENIDRIIRLNYEDALAWLKGPARFADIVDSTPEERGSEAYVISGPPRGWYPM